MLSICGCFVLINSVLGSIGTHFLSLFFMPVQIKKKLESLPSQFFWGTTKRTTKIPYISWNMVIASKDKGDLQFGSLEVLNYALLKKWRWRYYQSPNSIWVKLVNVILGTKN